MLGGAAVRCSVSSNHRAVAGSTDGHNLQYCKDRLSGGDFLCPAIYAIRHPETDAVGGFQCGMVPPVPLSCATLPYAAVSLYGRRLSYLDQHELPSVRGWRSCF